MIKLTTLINFLLLISFFFTLSFLEAREIILKPERASFGIETQSVSFTAEHALNPEETARGLMYRRHLPENHGMILHSQHPKKAKIWMLDTYIDLSVAMIDENGIIREIHDLKAYPEMMQGRNQFSNDNSIRNFFHQKSVKSRYPVKYVLEMNKGWFSKNHIQPGDVVNWDPNGERGWVIHTKDISNINSSESRPVLIALTKPGAQSITSAKNYFKRDVAFLDKDYRIVAKTTLVGKNNVYSKPVFYSQTPVHYILIAPAGWFYKYSIQINDLIRM